MSPPAKNHWAEGFQKNHKTSPHRTNWQTKAPKEYVNMAATRASHTHSCIHKQTLASCCMGITVLEAGDARPCLGELIIWWNVNK